MQEEEMSTPETTLQLARRHVTEGRERVSRQEALIARLVRDEHDHMLPNANALLDQLRGFLAFSEAHMERLIAEGAA